MNLNDDAILWSFLHFYHMDKANACMHCSPVKFSPLTFRLYEILLAGWVGEELGEMSEVGAHVDTYELDMGR